MLKLLWSFVMGAVIGCLIGAYDPNRVTQKDLDICKDETMMCQEMLNDPHHCVSVVVEAIGE